MPPLKLKLIIDLFYFIIHSLHYPILLIHSLFFPLSLCVFISFPAHHFLFVFLWFFTRPHLIILLHPSNYLIPQSSPLFMYTLLHSFNNCVHSHLLFKLLNVLCYKYVSLIFLHLCFVLFKFSFIHYLFYLSTSTLSYPPHLLFHFHLTSYPSCSVRRGVSLPL